MLHKYDIITTNSVGEAMRIIAGEAKGRKLYAPGGEDTRPTADRIRESVFGILGSRTQGARVLDLFGGTGALALEALSRGAAARDDRRQQCQGRCLHPPQRRGRVGRGMAPQGPRSSAPITARPSSACTGAYDLVFLDPPYRMEAAYGDALTRLRAAGLPGLRGAGDSRTRRGARHLPAGGFFRPRCAALRRNLRGICR